MFLTEKWTNKESFSNPTEDPVTHCGPAPNSRPKRIPCSFKKNLYADFGRKKNNTSFSSEIADFEAQ